MCVHLTISRVPAHTAVLGFFCVCMSTIHSMACSLRVAVHNDDVVLRIVNSFLLHVYHILVGFDVTTGT